MRSEKTTRDALRVESQNLVNQLNEFILEIEDGDSDLVELSFMIDRIERDFHLKQTLEACDEY